MLPAGALLAPLHLNLLQTQICAADVLQRNFTCQFAVATPSILQVLLPSLCLDILYVGNSQKQKQCCTSAGPSNHDVIALATLQGSLGAAGIAPGGSAAAEDYIAAIKQGCGVSPQVACHYGSSDLEEVLQDCAHVAPQLQAQLLQDAISAFGTLLLWCLPMLSVAMPISCESRCMHGLCTLLVSLHAASLFQSKCRGTCSVMSFSLEVCSDSGTPCVKQPKSGQK